MIKIDTGVKAGHLTGGIEKASGSFRREDPRS